MGSNRFSRLVKIITGTYAGAGEELLQLEGRFECFVHFCMLVWRHFVRNRCLIRASALAYTSLLALIPLLAVIISISSSLLKNQDEDKFYQAIASIMPPAASVPGRTHARSAETEVTNSVVSETVTNMDGEILTNAITAATTTNEPSADEEINTQKDLARWLHNLVQRTQNGAVGVTGMIVFVSIAILMLSRIEETFNDIWGVSSGRNWLTRIVLYWAAITLGPVLILIAISLAGSAHFQAAKDYFHQMPVFGNILFGLLPLVLLWFTFTLIYQIVPNTRVRFSAAFIGGVVAGTAWHLNNLFGFLYVSRVVTNSQMYGKLGLVPIFMLGLYFSWAILLFGAQVAYTFQNRAAYLQDKLADTVNQRGREFVAFRIMTLLGQRFQNGLCPATVIQLSTELAVPSRLTQHVLRTLGNARLVTEVGGGDEAAYVPARPLETINAHHILMALRCGAGCELPLSEAPELAGIYGEFARIEAAERMAAEKISMLALVHHAPPPVVLVTPEKPILDLPPLQEIRVPEVMATPEPEPAPEIVEPTVQTPAAPPETTITRREAARPEEQDFPL
jgi:membrane protein